jgi:hypothetical protein
MRKRKVFVAELECGADMSFEIFPDASVIAGGKEDDGYFSISPDRTENLTKGDVKEFFVVFRELLKEAKK